MKKALLILFAVSFALVAGCKLIDVVADAAAVTGVISSEQAQYASSGAKVASKTFDAMKDITPEQEYYIGRSVGATVLKTYQPYTEKTVNEYVNLLGQALAMASDMPETFGGYHFLIMATDEINAFGAPGGLIFVSRGLLKCCKNEDMLAAVLAHEIGHVQNKHGLRAIKASRGTAVFTTAAAEAGKSFGGAELAQLTTAFEGTIGDIAATMVNSGYARKLETQADTDAITIMKRVGYNPTAIKDMLLEMEKQLKHSKGGFAKTHPDPQVRIKDIEKLIGGCGPVISPKARQERFNRAMAQI
ncbi:MAG: M48 family metalloprotease [Lentisphaerae bacterium]|nr:M48 family metalloprotease [Lentisphaerota bacterium]